MPFPFDLESARALAERLHQDDAPWVFTNGHFDLLHVGHLDYLEQARALGAALIVGINGDESTFRLKGLGRPLTPALERARLLEALRPVTQAVIFDEDTAASVIKVLRPPIYVKGGDYAPDSSGFEPPLPERAAVEAYGGRVLLIPYLPGHATSDIIRRIRALP
jgi:rfaE bifunctional protein nucleotidyltransferase chain/domain